VDERAPKQRRLAGDEALAELTRRYFASHGPATVHDFAWWSGLTIGHAKRGLETLGKGMTSETLNGVTYWSAPTKARRAGVALKQPAVLLLPNYDEYLNALKDRSLALDPLGQPPTLNSFIGVPHQLVIDGILRGAWRRVTTSKAVKISVKSFRPLSRKEKDSLAESVAWHGEFLGLPATLTMA
ncbi:MAG TPA: crosslink repair DNA glycosylase YcaQ family protein, partial [Vicinamibacterales bacterium]